MLFVPHEKVGFMKFNFENIVRFIVLGLMMLLLTHSSTGDDDVVEVVDTKKEDSRVVAK